MSDADQLMAHAKTISEIGKAMDKLFAASQNGMDAIDLATLTRRALYTIHDALQDLSATAAKAEASFNLTVGRGTTAVQAPKP